MVAKVEFPIGKKLFHLVVNPGTWPGARPWTWNWYKLQETSMEHDIPFGNSIRGNGTTFLDFPLFLGIFQWDEPTKRVPFTAEPEIPEILTKWKAPLVTPGICLSSHVLTFLFLYCHLGCILKQFGHRPGIWCEFA